MGSSRLPGKIIKKLLDKEIVLWTYDRCIVSKADDVIIATSINQENDILERILLEKNIKYYRGSENDLLDRYYQIANKYNNNNLKIIRVTSDCPFIDTTMINNMIMYYENNNFDYIINHSPIAIIPEGSGIEIFNFPTLKFLWENNKNMEFREHVTGLLSKTKIYDSIIKIGYYNYLPNNLDVEKYKYIKLSIDTKDDFYKSILIANFFKSYDFKYEDILTNLNKIF